jgi:hypothetical protein
MSWLDWGILPDAALTGLGDAEKVNLQEQATKQWMLGSLLSGDPSAGFKSAISLPEQSLAAQQRLKSQQDLQELYDFRSTIAPTTQQAGYRAMSGGGGPTVANAKTQEQIVNTPIDIDAAQRMALGMVGNTYQPRIVESLKNMQNKFQPEIGGFITPGGKVADTVPISDKSGITRQYNPVTKQWTYSAGGGATNAISALTSAETLARELSTPRQVTGKSGAPTFIYPNAPTPPIASSTIGNAGGNVNAPQTANDVALQKAADARFGDFSKSVSDSASTANDRIAASQRMYDIAERVNGNKFTDLTAEGAAYMRGLPFVGDKFDQYVSDVKMFNVDKSKQVLSGLNNIKGNANGFEGAVVEKSASSITDPKAATKFIAALEIAAAEKDLAAQRYIESYNGPVGEARSKWSTSPENPRIYNHPKVEQFLREQISSNPAKPVLPAGFGLVQNKSGQYGVRKPDGSVMSLGQ